MKVLIVEDNQAKAAELIAFLSAEFPTATTAHSRSYNSGLLAIRDTLPELIVLDMSMPTFDQSGAQSGGRRRPYAGRDVLREIKRLQFPVKAVVFTQYERFGEGPQERTLKELGKELKDEFAGIYIGTVYYHPSLSNWRQQLTHLIRTAGIKKNPSKKRN